MAKCNSLVNESVSLNTATYVKANESGIVLNLNEFSSSQESLDYLNVNLIPSRAENEIAKNVSVHKCLLNEKLDELRVNLKDFFGLSKFDLKNRPSSPLSVLSPIQSIDSHHQNLFQLFT